MNLLDEIGGAITTESHQVTEDNNTQQQLLLIKASSTYEQQMTTMPNINRTISVVSSPKTRFFHIFVSVFQKVPCQTIPLVYSALSKA